MKKEYRQKRMLFIAAACAFIAVAAAALHVPSLLSDQNNEKVLQEQPDGKSKKEGGRRIRKGIRSHLLPGRRS